MVSRLSHDQAGVATQCPVNVALIRGRPFTVLQGYFISEFTDHISSIDPHIQFTVKEGVQLPFLDTLVILKDDGTLKVKVYSKDTDMDQYLNWDAYQQLEYKRSVIRTLPRRADRLVSDPLDRDEEIKYVKPALTEDKWIQTIGPHLSRQMLTQLQLPPQFGVHAPAVCIPHIPEVSDRLQRVFKSYGISSYHKPFNTLHTQLVNPRT